MDAKLVDNRVADNRGTTVATITFFSSCPFQEKLEAHFFQENKYTIGNFSSPSIFRDRAAFLKRIIENMADRWWAWFRIF